MDDPALSSIPSRWSRRLHVGLTILSVGALAAVASLAAAGRLHLDSRLSAGNSHKQSAKEKETPVATNAGGRYRIEPVEDVRQLLNRSGRNGFFGYPAVHEAWAFKFSGGFVECQVETDFAGKFVARPATPQNWAGLLRLDENLKIDDPMAYQREGHIVLTAMSPGVPEDLAPYYPHLGGLFVAGPAGPLHQLTMLHLEVRRLRAFRIFITVGPRNENESGRFNLWSQETLPFREPLIPRNTFYAGGGKDLAPGREVTILDSQPGITQLRVKARFLGDGEVAALAKK